MKLCKKRMGLLTFVGISLLVAALLSLWSATWATPEQRVRMNGDSDTIPDKYSDKVLVARGQSAEFEILVTNPSTASDTWTNTVVTDTIDSNLEITGLATTQGSTSWLGQNVTFTIGAMAPGSSVTLNIYVDVEDDAPQGYDVYNTAYMKHDGWVWVPSDPAPPAWMFRIAYLQRLPLGMKRY
jgi:fimbrial isopeptide formation D2 family protein